MCVYIHTHQVCVYIYTHTYTMYAHHTHRHHIHTYCTCNIHKHHTTHQAQRLKQQTPSPYTLHHAIYTPYHIHTIHTCTQSICTPLSERRCPHTHRCYSIHTKTMFLTHKYTIVHLPYPPHTKHQRANTRHLPPPPPCHTHSHTQLQHTHHKNHSYISTHLSLLPRLL